MHACLASILIAASLSGDGASLSIGFRLAPTASYTLPYAEGARLAAPVPAAEAPQEPDELDESPRRHWYGGQLMLADLGAITLIGAAAVTNNVAPFYLGLGVFLGAPPFIHAAHGRPGAAVGSFLLRGVPLGLGIAGAVVAQRNCRAPDDTCGLGALFFGSLGSAVGMIIDWTALSTETVTPPTMQRWSLASVAAEGKHGAGLAVAARF